MKLFAVAAALAAASFAAPAAAQMELKFGHVGNPGSLFEASAEEFAKRANAKLGGKAKVVVFGSSQLGNDRELLQKLKLGTVDFAYGGLEEGTFFRPFNTLTEGVAAVPQMAVVGP